MTLIYKITKRKNNKDISSGQEIIKSLNFVPKKKKLVTENIVKNILEMPPFMIRQLSALSSELELTNLSISSVVDMWTGHYV